MIRSPKGRDPETIGFRAGALERIENLRTGKVQAGKDISADITNRKTTPAKSLVVLKTTKKGQVKFPNTRKFGIVSRKIRRLGPETTAISFRSRGLKTKGKRTKASKLVKRKGE